MKIICIGRNYADHISELNNERPTEPVIFMKPDSAILPNKNPFVIPAFSNDIHHEVEILVKICKVGKHIDAKFANKYYEEIGLGIDFTARDVQSRLKEKGLPWEKAKAFDNSAAVGKFIDIVPGFNKKNINFTLYKNKELVQQGNSNQMTFNFENIISHVSSYFSLNIGDLIFTGTPAGVGECVVGDELEGFIENEMLLKMEVK